MRREGLYARCQEFYLESGHCSVRSHLGRSRIVEDLMCVIIIFEKIMRQIMKIMRQEYLIWQCERFRVERHRLIDALAALIVMHR
jgi:hypothetical protein